jgi:hypothetical protein
VRRDRHAATTADDVDRHTAAFAELVDALHG